MNEINEAIKTLENYAPNRDLSWEKTRSALIVVIAALRAQLERESEPKPLTLEQLREVDGAVWVISLCWRGWAFVNIGYEDGECIVQHKGLSSEMSLKFKDYGKLWIAYPRKPRED